MMNDSFVYGLLNVIYCDVYLSTEIFAWSQNKFFSHGDHEIENGFVVVVVIFPFCEVNEIDFFYDALLIETSSSLVYLLNDFLTCK